jgi:hypothetical protein
VSLRALWTGMLIVAVTVGGGAAFAAGGPTDVVTRALADKLGERLGQPAVVLNKPGSGGLVGAEFVAKSKADGHHVLVLSLSHLLRQAIDLKMPIDVLKDLEPISLYVSQPLVIVVKGDSRFKTIVEVEEEGRCRADVIRRFDRMIDPMLKWYRMIEGAPELPETVHHFEGTFLHTTVGGLYCQTADLLERVAAGQVVATVSEYFGEVLEEIRAPYDGVVMSKRTFGGVEPGGWTLMVGKLV